MRYPTRLAAFPRYVLATHLAVFGLLYALGPARWYSSTSFVVLKAIGVPVWVWGLLFLLTGVLLYAGQLTAGHGGAAVLLLFWGVCLAASAVHGQLTGAGAPVHCLTLAAMHLWALNVRTREKAGAGG